MPEVGGGASIDSACVRYVGRNIYLPGLVWFGLVSVATETLWSRRKCRGRLEATELNQATYVLFRYEITHISTHQTAIYIFLLFKATIFF